MRIRLASVALLLVTAMLAGVGRGAGVEPPLIPDELTRRAWDRGRVRVIVRLDTAFVPEAALPTAAHVAQQHQTIASAQSIVSAGLRGFPHRVIRQFPGLPLMAIEVDAAGLRALEALRGVVAGVEEDRLHFPMLAQSVPLINADEAWTTGYDGAGTIVAILDTGVAKSHAFFGGRVVAEACFSTSDPDFGIVSLCPGGVDGPGNNTALNCSTSVEGCDHGTHVAGIAAGGTTGASGSGVAPAARIMAIKVYSQANDAFVCGGPPSCIGAFASDVIAGLSHVYNSRNDFPGLTVAAVNLSLGSLDVFTANCDTDSHKPAIDQLRAAGIATVVASGNQGSANAMSAPACISSAVSVGSTTKTDVVSFFSNAASFLSLLAPGGDLSGGPGDIRSSVPGGGFGRKAGTSMATPHVAGAFAVLRQAVPTATVAELLQALQATGEPISDGRNGITFPRIDVLAALDHLVPTSVEFSSAAYSAGEETGTATITLTRSGDTSGTSTVRVSTSNGTATAGSDYLALTEQLVTFGPGETTKSIDVTLVDDFAIEADETVNLTLGSPTAALLGTQRTGVLTIVSDDQSGVFVLSAGSYSVDEGAGTAAITVTRTAGLAAGVSVRVSTSNGTAVAGQDYTAISDLPLTFAGGETSKTFNVAITNDTINEADETVILTLSSPSAGASLGDPATATLTIQDNDAPGTLQFGSSTYSVNESSASVSLTVTRTGGTASGVTVHYSIADSTALGGATATSPGADYVTKSGTLTFGAGVVSQIFAVTIVNDTRLEPPETFTITLDSPGGGASLGAVATTTVTIVDNDAPTVKFGAATSSVVEGATAAITVQRANGLGSAVSADYEVTGGTATGDGVDYTLASGTVSFAVGQTTATISVPTTADTVADPAETVIVKLVGASAGSIIGSPDTTSLTIVDNDVAGAVQFSAAAFSVAEPVGATVTATIKVTRSGGAASGVTVDYAVTGGTATAGGDYDPLAPGTLTFGAGETMKPITIVLRPDALVEGDEAVVLTLSNAGGRAMLGPNRTTVLTIKDAQVGVQFGRAAYTVSEGTPSATITAVRTGPTIGTSVVAYSTGDGTATAGADYTAVSGILTFGPGVTSKSFTVPILNDSLVEGPETVLLLLSNVSGGTGLGPISTAVLTITDNDVAGTVRLGAPAYSVSEAMPRATLTVQRSGGLARDVTVNYATSSSPAGPGVAAPGIDYEETSGSVTFGPGETTKTLTIPILPDRLVEGNESFTVTLSLPVNSAALLGAPSSAVVTIVDNDAGGVIQLGASSVRVNEPVSVTTTATIQVTRTGSNPAGGVTVQYATTSGTAVAGIDYVPAAGTLVFDAGETSKLVPVSLLPDPGATSNRTFGLTLSNAAGGGRLGTPVSTTVTIVNTTQTLHFGSAAYTVDEAPASAAVTVLRSGPPTGTVTVTYDTTPGGAMPGADYTPKSGTLTFLPGVVSQTILIPILDDTTLEADEDFSVRLLVAGGAAAVGTPSTATVTVRDNDGPGTFQFATAEFVVAEGGLGTIKVTRTGGSAGTVTVPWSSSAVSATPGTDFTPTSGTLTFAPGITIRALTITAVNDTMVEGEEAATLTLGPPSPAGSSGAQTTTALRILDNDVAGTIKLGAATYSVTEGGTVNVKVIREGGAASGTAVTLETADFAPADLPAGLGAAAAGVDYAAIAPMPLTFAAGEITKTVTLRALPDGLAEGNEAFRLVLGVPPGSPATLGAPSAAMVRIVDDEPRVQFGAPVYSVTEGGALTVTVTRTGPTTSPVTVNWATTAVTATSGVDYTPTSGTLSFAAGQTTRSFAITAVDDGAAEGPETFMLTLSNAAGASIGTPATAPVTIVDNEAAGVIQFATPAVTVAEPATVTATARLVVTRTGKNLVGGVTVRYTTSDDTATAPSDYTAASEVISFPAGETTAFIDIPIHPDALQEGTKMFSVTLSDPSPAATLGPASRATVFIVDSQQTVAFARAEYSVGETSTKAVIAVVRDGLPEGTITVHAGVVTGTASPLTDYVAPNATLTFGPGEVVKNLVVPIRLTAAANPGNRTVVLELDSPSDASLGTPSTTTLTILDFRPDLVTTSVTLPGSTLGGKTLGSPITVKNSGLVASPAFRVGLFLSPDGTPDADQPGAGELRALIPIASLAPGSTVTLPGALTLDDDLPQGQYFVSAVADFSQAVPEANETNNGRTASTPLRINRNLTKFRAAAASLSQSGCTNPDDGGTVNLTGSFIITSQSGTTATGTADLSGTLNGFPVRYQMVFTLDVADDNTVTTSSLTFPSVTGAFVGTGVGNLTGMLVGRVLSGNITGQVTRASGESCSFAGTLSANAEPSFLFNVVQLARGGGFGSGATATLGTLPIAVDSYLGMFRVLFDQDLPNPDQVLFTGPAGTGLITSPGQETQNFGSETDYLAAQRERVNGAPAGSWSVRYKGVTRAFTLLEPDAANRLVVPRPTVTVDGSGFLTDVSWEWLDRRTGGPVPALPSFVGELRVFIDGSSGEDFVYRSPRLDRATTSHTLTSPVLWGDVEGVLVIYRDTLSGNLYAVESRKETTATAELRKEKTYTSVSFGGTRTEDILNLFYNAPVGMIDHSTPCPPSNVTVQGGPFASPTDVCFSSQATFGDGQQPVEIFNIRQPLTGAPPAVGTQFTFTATPVSGPVQQLIASLRAPLPAQEIDITNLSGFSIRDAKLGIAQEVRWTLPPPASAGGFDIAEVQLQGIVNTTGFAQFCHAPQPELPTNATSGTVRLPSTCNGQAVSSASICVFVKGQEGQVTAACWQFFDP
jgi:subtilisin family serine protease